MHSVMAELKPSERHCSVLCCAGLCCAVLHSAVLHNATLLFQDDSKALYLFGLYLAEA